MATYVGLPFIKVEAACKKYKMNLQDYCDMRQTYLCERNAIDFVECTQCGVEGSIRSCEDLENNA